MTKTADPTSKLSASQSHGHPATTDFYADPLIYDILHAKGTAAEVRALTRITNRFFPNPRKKLTWGLEPACGTARHLRHLKKQDHRVLGFDAEPAMVAYARRHLPRSIFEARLDTFLNRRPSLRAHIAFNLINTIRHARSDAEILRHLSMIARTLHPGGLYIVGLSLSLYSCESPTEDVWTGARASTKVTQVVQFIPPEGDGSSSRDEHVISHITVRTRTTTRDLDSTYTLRTYSLQQWHRLIERSPLKIIAVTDQDGIEIDESPLGYALYVLTPK